MRIKGKPPLRVAGLGDLQQIIEDHAKVAGFSSMGSANADKEVRLRLRV